MSMRSPAQTKTQLTFTPVQTSLLQRKCASCGQHTIAGGECEECQKKRSLLQRRSTNQATSSKLPTIVHEVLRSPGHPLNSGTQNFMESRFGQDFSRVRVHTDAKAARSARAVNALAYTVGQEMVFATGQYAPGTMAGQKLLAHELTHVVQQQGAQSGTVRPLLSEHDDPYEREAKSNELSVSERVSQDPVPLIQRDIVGPAATGTPTDWSRRVEAAESSAARASLVQEALGSIVTVVDRTGESQGDERPNPEHLLVFTAASPRINYDDNLQRKQGVDGRPLSQNAGYYLNSDDNHYVILSRDALQANNFFATRVTLNHEFDHLRQAESGTALTRDESELDAYTGDFIRAFHRTYTLRVSSRCYVDRISLFRQLLIFFSRPDVSDTARNNSASRIIEYYNNTLRSHPGHNQVFRFWILNTFQNETLPDDLARRLNTDLSLGIDPNARSIIPGSRYRREIDCTGLRQATFPSPPEVELPAAGGLSSGGARRIGLQIGGGISFPADQLSTALSLGARYSLRSDQAIILNPLIGARLLYLPPGDRTTHLTALIGEIGLRVQQPLRGVYLDARVGGQVGLEWTTPEPRVEGGLTGTIGFGYRWERVELGAEALGMLGLGGSPSRFIILGVGGISF